jgi:hypothetical protein
MSISALGSVKGKEAGAEAQDQVVALKKSAAKICEHHLQIFEAHVLANPQSFALMKHGRMRGITVDTVVRPGAMTRISGMPCPASNCAL